MRKIAEGKKKKTSAKISLFDTLKRISPVSSLKAYLVKRTNSLKYNAIAKRIKLKCEHYEVVILLEPQ